MKTLPLAPSSKAAQPNGVLPFGYGSAVGGEHGWFSFSASSVGASSTETISFLRPSSLPAGGAVDSDLLHSVAPVQKAGVLVQAGGSVCAVCSNMAVKTDCGIGGVSPASPPRATAAYL